MTRTVTLKAKLEAQQRKKKFKRSSQTIPRSVNDQGRFAFAEKVPLFQHLAERNHNKKDGEEEEGEETGEIDEVGNVEHVGKKRTVADRQHDVGIDDLFVASVMKRTVDTAGGLIESHPIQYEKNKRKKNDHDKALSRSDSMSDPSRHVGSVGEVKAHRHSEEGNEVDKDTEMDDDLTSLMNKVEALMDFKNSDDDSDHIKREEEKPRKSA